MRQFEGYVEGPSYVAGAKANLGQQQVGFGRRSIVMAQRGEGQGLQIAVISFAMLTIILAITTYVFYAQSASASKDVVPSPVDTTMSSIATPMPWTVSSLA